MDQNSKFSLVITTSGSDEHASVLAGKIIAEKLAACVQLQKITSYYMWKGDSCKEAEVLLLIKTRSSLYKRLEEFIRNNHTYETPEVIQLNIVNGSQSYLNWVEEMTNE